MFLFIFHEITRAIRCFSAIMSLNAALIKSFSGLTEASDARATRPHRDRIRHCDHCGIVGTSSPRDGRRWHCRYSVPGMQMASRWMVICRLIRPTNRPKTPRTILIPARSECAKLFAAIPTGFLRRLAFASKRSLEPPNFLTREKKIPPPP